MQKITERLNRQKSQCRFDETSDFLRRSEWKFPPPTTHNVQRTVYHGVERRGGANLRMRKFRLIFICMARVGCARERKMAKLRIFPFEKRGPFEPVRPFVLSEVLACVDLGFFGWVQGGFLGCIGMILCEFFRIVLCGGVF